MLIFDAFPSAKKAEEFASTCSGDRLTIVCSTMEEFDEHECFPFEVTLPVVLVERNFDQDNWNVLEEAIAQRAKKFGGHFAGT